MKPALLLAVSLVVAVSQAAPAAAQTTANLLLVVNQSSPDSVRIGEHYARVRGVSQDQVLRISTDGSADEIDRAVFDGQIQAPIAAWLRRHSAQDRILYIVLTRGIPLRIKGSLGRNGTVASVDSELTLLYRRMTGQPVPAPGQLANPFYLGDAAVSQATRFNHRAFDIYLVTRLDGFTVDDVLRAVDRGSAPVREGKIVLDQKGGLGGNGGDAWMKAAADWLTANGFGSRVVLEGTGRPSTGERGVLGYYS